ncbi:MAG: hypothetical protein R8G34_10990 [Paracoccaceae bacterium]|nr:hypothetical protein [Paracoccaceae bacterium]
MEPLLLLSGRDSVWLTPAREDFCDLADGFVALNEKVPKRVEGYDTVKRAWLKVIANSSHPALRIVALYSQRHLDVDANFSLFDWTSAPGIVRHRFADLGPVIDASTNG